MHGIIVLNDTVRASLADAQNIIVHDDIGSVRQMLRLGILGGRINHWWQTYVWKSINQKTKRWENYGNAITTNISFATNIHIKPFLITS